MGRAAGVLLFFPDGELFTMGGKLPCDEKFVEELVEPTWTGWRCLWAFPREVGCRSAFCKHRNGPVIRRPPAGVIVKLC